MTAKSDNTPIVMLPRPPKAEVIMHTVHISEHKTLLNTPETLFLQRIGL